MKASVEINASDRKELDQGGKNERWPEPTAGLVGSLANGSNAAGLAVEAEGRSAKKSSKPPEAAGAVAAGAGPANRSSSCAAVGGVLPTDVQTGKKTKRMEALETTSSYTEVPDK